MSKNDDKPKEAVYEKPTSQLDLEARQADDYESPLRVAATGEPGDTPFDNAGYIGVDPVYQNAANETERPMRQTEGPEAQVIKDAGHEHNTGTFDDESPVPTADERPEKEDKSDEEDENTESATPPTPSTPTAPAAKKAAASPSKSN